MAERRMFAKTIIDSDAFLDMSVTARLLYYDLSMRADDDGFINSPKKIMRMVGASEDDLRMLAARKFIIPFENGVVVIKHWRIHNYIRKDTYNATPYKDERAALEFDENNAYRLKQAPPTERIRTVDEPSTQVRLGKDSLGKDIYNVGQADDFTSKCKEITAYLNEKSGTNYKCTSEKTRRCIRARFNEGFTVDDFKTVIDKKTEEWNGTEFQQYLRPETLFGTKFEGYLNSPVKTKKQSSGGAGAFGNYKQRDIDFEALNKKVFAK